MNIMHIIKSVMSAMIGVQKKKNLQSDFSKSSATPFILVGIIMTVLFILIVIFVVNIVLKIS